MGSKTPASLIGVVVRAGTMDKVVKVRRAHQKFDSFLQKVLLRTGPHCPNMPLLSQCYSAALTTGF